VHFLTKEPVKTPDDLRKLKIFTWQDDASGASDLWKAAGFTAVPLPSTEISSALQTGLVTALPTSAYPASLMLWNQHARYMTNLNWATLIAATVVTKKSWDKIPADLQAKLKASAAKAGEKLRADSRKTDGEAIKGMAAHGLTVIEPDLDAWRKVVEPTWPRMRGSLVPEDFFDKVKKLRDEQRAAKGAKPAATPAATPGKTKT
jgi:TRAP-type C4-dicarboxylate transport system substrate-binding protein